MKHQHSFETRILDDEGHDHQFDECECQPLISTYVVTLTSPLLSGPFVVELIASSPDRAISRMRLVAFHRFQEAEMLTADCSAELLVVCQWFALCDHEATGVIVHPVLGDVPACQRCIDKLGLS